MNAERQFLAQVTNPEVFVNPRKSKRWKTGGSLSLPAVISRLSQATISTGQCRPTAFLSVSNYNIARDRLGFSSRSSLILLRETDGSVRRALLSETEKDYFVARQRAAPEERLAQTPARLSWLR
jgi:hypothetical protein